MSCWMHLTFKDMINKEPKLHSFIKTLLTCWVHMAIANRYEYMKHVIYICQMSDICLTMSDSDIVPQVCVEYTPDRGRHLKAARALQIGEVSFPILLKREP